MSALKFQLKKKLAQRLDLSPLTPSKLARMKLREIEALVIGTTRDALKVGDVFKVKAGDASTIRFVSTDATCDRIGQDMGEGEIVIEGDAGAYLGERMKGGSIALEGSAGFCAGAAMAGGIIEISKHVGERAGGVAIGETFGMRGGRLVVKGNAGPMLGERMRRGLIVVNGNAAEYAGARAIAGTIMIARKVGRWAGYGLRRASLILAKEPEELLPTFGDSGVLDFNYLRLLDTQLKAAGIRTKFGFRARRLMGDMAVLGKGEMLILA